MPRTVLVVTEQFDVTADHVVLALEEREVPVFRFDTAEFPQALTMSVRLDQNQSGVLRTPAREVSFDDVGAVYWRRPSIYQFPPTLNADDAAWATREARFGVGGVLATMPAWLNHPACIARAEYKPVQFAAAREAGLTLPPTLVTNDFHAARKFAKEVGAIVYKPLSGVQYKHAAGYDSLTYAAISTPDHVRTAVVKLTSVLGLRFGALDFIVTPTGEWVFLEISPNGQWAWIDDATPTIANAIADALEGRTEAPW